MSQNLNVVIPTLYEALDIVSRELVGLIPSVSRDSNADRAAKNQMVSSHIVPEVEIEDITPGNDPADSGDTELDNVNITISKAKAAPVRWTGEEQTAVAHSGQLQAVQRDRFAQAMRALCNEVERDVASVYDGASRVYGTPGTTPFGSDLSDVAELLKILKDNGAPIDSLNLVFNTSAGANLRSLTQLTDVNRAGTDRTLRQGVLLDVHGFSLRESAGIQTKDVSDEDDGGSITTAGSENNKGATEINVNVATSAVKVLAGNYVTIGDHKYMVTDEFDQGAGDNLTLKIAKPGLMEDVADGTSVEQNDADFVANLAFARTAIHLVTRAPAMPQGGDAADDVIEIQDPVSGLAFQVAMYRQYRRVKYEVGLAWGFKLVKPEHVAILAG
jgi:hypothetical protein